jgi:phosphate:Na+ symporter
MLNFIWQFIIGLGIFLYGMQLLESGVRELSGAQIKKWLASSTHNPAYSAASGVIYTAILQSSSMVSLLVMAFASAGLLPLFNAIGILLGANLGTTFTGWIIATIGFKLDLAAAALPLLGAGALLQVFANKPSRASHIGQLIAGLGLLLFGLSFMKDGVTALADNFDIAALGSHSPMVYLLVGTAIAAIVQSSSATVMMALAALHGGIIQLPDAAALVIGADLGTTSTTLLGSLSGATIKRQLALAHVVFNFSVDIAAFFLLLPALPFAFDFFNFTEPLYGLVAFHSFFNLLGLLIFMPILKQYSSWIKTFFNSETSAENLTDVIPTVPEAAVHALAKQLQPLWLNAVQLNTGLFSISLNEMQLNDNIQAQIDTAKPVKNNAISYEYIKTREVDIIRFCAIVQQQKLDPALTELLNQVLDIARSVVYGCKTMQDISDNLATLSQPSFSQSALGNNDVITRQIYADQRSFYITMHQKLISLVINKHEMPFVEEQVQQLDEQNNTHFNTMNRLLYQQVAPEKELSDGYLLSTLLNVNREIHHSTKNMIASIVVWQQLKDNLQKVITHE